MILSKLEFVRNNNIKVYKKGKDMTPMLKKCVEFKNHYKIEDEIRNGYISFCTFLVKSFEFTHIF